MLWMKPPGDSESEAGSPNPKHAILLLQRDALQKELGRPVPLIGFCGQLASGDITLPDISGPFVGRRVAVYHCFSSHNWTVATRRELTPAMTQQ